jgi:hypothetical protein
MIIHVFEKAREIAVPIRGTKIETSTLFPSGFLGLQVWLDRNIYFPGTCNLILKRRTSTLINCALGDAVLLRVKVNNSRTSSCQVTVIVRVC